MFDFLRHKEKIQVEAPNLGALYFNKVDGICSWDGLLEFDMTGKKIELSIETSSEEPPSVSRIVSKDEFLSSYANMKAKLFTHIHNAYQHTQYAFPIEHVVGCMA